MRFTLYKFTFPVNNVPANVAVPASAVNKPLLFNEEEAVKSVEVVTLPVINNPLKERVPELVMFFPVPFIVIIPDVAVKEPVTSTFPFTKILLVVVITPETDISFNVILLPVIVLVVPLIANTPEVWL